MGEGEGEGRGKRGNVSEGERRPKMEGRREGGRDGGE
jgi:hypothetical protein